MNLAFLLKLAFAWLSEQVCILKGASIKNDGLVPVDEHPIIQM